jgi:hypothetical protein
VKRVTKDDRIRVASSGYQEPQNFRNGRGGDEKEGMRKHGQQVVNYVELGRLTCPQHDATFTSFAVSCALTLAFAFATLITS